MWKVTKEPDNRPKNKCHRRSSTRQDMPIKLPLNSLKTIRVDTPDPSGKVASAQPPPRENSDRTNAMSSHLPDSGAPWIHAGSKAYQQQNRSEGRGLRVSVATQATTKLCHPWRAC